MSNVIALNEKLKVTAAQKALELRKRKVRALYRVFQCTQCASKCERCGATIEGHQAERSAAQKIPYHFCDSCAEEYRDYIHCLQGMADPDITWHNHQWLRVWQTWIEYQGAVDQYLRSKEFRGLLSELGPMDPPCK
ncbi:MAG: hypothetical protein M0036_02825 [Desulfobacteraceae bacterium]|nr:hypothetical protein [Desulfobacteraceae bacterium]